LARSITDIGNDASDGDNTKNTSTENTYQATKKEVTNTTETGNKTVNQADSNNQIRYDGNTDQAGIDHHSTGAATETPPRKRRQRGRRSVAMEVTVEIDWVTGPEAADLAYRQWLVIKEVLQWINDHPGPKPETQQPPHPGPAD
jgi:hypothetical protein